MRFIKQKTHIAVQNNDDLAYKSTAVKRHSDLLPNNARILIIGILCLFIFTFIII